MIKRRGITLIELLITMALIGLVLIIITSVYITGYRTFDEELASSAVQSNAQSILDSILLDAKNGMLVEQSYEGKITGTDTIIIRVPAVNTDKEIQYSGTDMLFDRVVYYYTNNEIHKITFSDNPSSIRFSQNGIDKTLNQHVLSLNFTYDPDQTTATLVTATISSNIKVGTRNKHIVISGEARLRNHI